MRLCVVNLSWADASDIKPFDTCKLYPGMLFVSSRPICFSEPNNDVSSSFMERERIVEELELKMAAAWTGAIRVIRLPRTGHTERIIDY
jgi:hypothetical protein